MLQNNEQPNLMQVQINLEESMKQRGVESYLRSVNRAKAGVSEDHTQYGTRLISGYTKVLAQAIQKFKDEASSGRAGSKHTVLRYIGDQITTDQIAFLVLKTIIAGISGSQTAASLAVQIGTVLEDEMRLANIRMQEKRVYDSIVTGTMKRGSQHYKHVYAVRRAEYFKDGWVDWSRASKALIGSKMLDLVVANLELVDLEVKQSGVKSVYMITAKPSTVEWIEKYNMAGVRSPFEPMVVLPRDWTTPHDGGYITSNITPLHLVKRVTQKRLVALYGNAPMPKVYATVNALQHTAWQINAQVLDVMRTLWDNGSGVGGLPSREDLVLPPKPHDMDTNEGAALQWRRDASQAHRNHLEATSARIAFSMTMDVATRYSEFKKIYMPYQLDFRGRVYAVPHLNPQGSDFQKSLLRFSKEKPLGEGGVKWLAIHGANLAGVDKVSFQERVDWVENNEEQILAIASDPFTNRGWATSIGDVEIDKPWQFLAFCFEWAGYCEKGESYVSHMPIALDGSCSGIQHFSAMLRDSVGGAAVNLVPQEKPADVYGTVANKVLEKVREDLVTGTDDGLTEAGTLVQGTKTLAAQWLAFGITRKTCKRSVMTLAYGSREYGFKEQLMEDIISPAQKVMGSQFPFEGDGFRAAAYLAKKIWESVTVTLVAAGQAMDWIKAVAAVANQAKQAITWTTPAGFTVEQSYKSMKDLQVETAINGKIRLYLKEPIDKLDLRKQTSAISPNWVHSLDSSHLMMTVCEAVEQGIDSFAMIHDSFGTYAADTDKLFEIVRDTFVDMYEKHDVLDMFKKGVAASIDDETLQEELPDDLVRGDLDLEDVKYSMYCFA
ncbi:DNA-directed RNA polymerase [Polynucleobacter sp. MG-27-Goln-C1]|uniref:DNA-directed RNA polymerase n=1 Tax=Polynucleobacter sp. MG-27-Goln-C1 TaxID=1819726 RepID=UPI001C0B5E3B|nr:DNA-directed RNA polymerase [Polynucleobacter sp. MG-27-Goln-C1]MBU3613158.1 DNA-dependent RNA polymerase [Polynucleobacter sp. MG-27-Goln-C1]